MIKRWIHDRGKGMLLRLIARWWRGNAPRSEDARGRIEERLAGDRVELAVLAREIEALEAEEARELGRARSTNLGTRARRIARMSVRRLRQRLDRLQVLLEIHDRSATFHSALLDRRLATEALGRADLREWEVEEILAEFDSELARWGASVEGPGSAPRLELGADPARDAELAAIEDEVLGSGAWGRDGVESSALGRREEAP